MRLGILHHVCGEHEWDGGMCSHGPLTEIEGGKEFLPMTSKAAKELQKIVLDREWLKSLEHYVRFRYGFFRISVVLITLETLSVMSSTSYNVYNNLHFIWTEAIKINFLPIFLFPLTFSS